MSNAKDKKPVKVKLTIEVFEDGVPTDVVLLAVALKLADECQGETRDEDAMLKLMSAAAFAAVNHTDWPDAHIVDAFDGYVFGHRQNLVTRSTWDDDVLDDKKVTGNG